MTRETVDTPGDLFEDYLDRLLVSLSGSPRQVRHTLAEVEAHLHDAVAEGIAAGLPEEIAQVQALERIGPVHAVTGRSVVLARPSAALLRRLTLTAVLVGGAGFAAIGAAGLLGRLLQALKGNPARAARAGRVRSPAAPLVRPRHRHRPAGRHGRGPGRDPGRHRHGGLPRPGGQPRDGTARRRCR